MLSIAAAPDLDRIQGKRRSSARERIDGLLHVIDGAVGAPTWRVTVQHKGGTDTRVFTDQGELETYVSGVLRSRFTSFSVTRDR